MAKIVNGFKVVKRYPIGGFISAIILLALVAIPFANMFFPIFKFADPLGKFGTPDVIYRITIIDLIVGLLLVFGIAIPNPSSQAVMIQHLISGMDGKGGTIPSKGFALGFNIIAIIYVLMLIVMAILAIIMLINAFAFVIRGRLSNYHRPLSLSIAFGIFGAIYCVGSIAVDYFYVVKYNASFQTSIEQDLILPIILGSIFVALVILQTITYCISFRDKYFIDDVKAFGNNNNTTIQPAEVNVTPQPVVVNINNPAPVQANNGAPVTYELPNGNLEPKQIDAVPSGQLPSNLTNIPGHAYSQNTSLKYAVIPEGIESIGVGAFANCLYLQMVTLPKTLNHIGYNAFFNCANLTKINYAGTKEEWSKIIRGSNWLSKVPTNVVECSNGKIIVDPIR